MDEHRHGEAPAEPESPPKEPGHPLHPEVHEHAPAAPAAHARDEHTGNTAHATPPEHAAHPAHAGPAVHAAPTAHADHGGQAAPAAHVVQAPHAGHAGHAGHDKHAGHSVAMFRDRFWISLALTVPTLIWGPMLQGLLHYAPPRFPGSDWIPPLFGAAVFFYGGLVFIRGAAGELRDRLPGMMTLISLAIGVAFVFSIVVTLGYPGMPLWEELATLVTIMLLGHWLEMRSISQASGALRELARLLPRVATRILGGQTEEVPLEELREGDLLLIRPGAGIPADGTVREGRSDVNESMLTGESRAVAKGAGDRVIGGTVNGAGSLRVEVSGIGENTALARIMRLVSEAQTSRSRAQALADRAAFFLTIVAIASAVLTLVAWILVGARGDFVIERVVTVLVIACPHALGLAIPLVIAISTTLAARNGLLVRDRRGLEEARRLTAVVFDKTGTLTLGEPRVVDAATIGGLSADEAVRLIASVEGDSEHPIARAIVASARERGLEVPASSGFEALPGRGVRARVDGRTLEVGGPNLLRQLSVEPAAELVDAAGRFAGRGQSAIYLVEGGRAVAVLAVADKVREESREAIERLHRAGIRVAMLTGDAQAVADAVAADLRIDTVFAEVLPDQKAAKIRELQGRGERVAMVGDGVNDAPALVTADVGVAIGAGTDVAVEAGDVVLVRNDPRDIPRIIALSRATYRKMLQNLAWAAGYNVVAIPLAAGVLAHRGIVLHPAVGAVLMSASTVIVALNAQLLRRVRL